MRLNSPQSIELGRKLIQQYGDWDSVRRAGRVDASGIVHVKLDDDHQGARKADAAAPRLAAFRRG